MLYPSHLISSGWVSYSLIIPRSLMHSGIRVNITSLKMEMSPIFILPPSFYYSIPLFCQKYYRIFVRASKKIIQIELQYLEVKASHHEPFYHELVHGLRCLTRDLTRLHVLPSTGILSLFQCYFLYTGVWNSVSFVDISVPKSFAVSLPHCQN